MKLEEKYGEFKASIIKSKLSQAKKGRALSAQHKANLVESRKLFFESLTPEAFKARVMKINTEAQARATYILETVSNLSPEATRANYKGIVKASKLIKNSTGTDG